MKANYKYRIGLILLLSTSIFYGCRKDTPIEVNSRQTQGQQVHTRTLNDLLSVPQRGTKVSMEQALAATQNKEQSSLRSLQNKSIKSNFTLYTGTGEPALYVINYEPEGYAVVSASRKYTPIIANSPRGYISLSDGANPTTKALLEDYVKRVEYAETLPDSLTRLARLQWEMLGEDKPQQLRSIVYDEDMFRKISDAIYKYKQEGYRVYRYRDIMGDYDNPNDINMPQPPGDYPYHHDDYILTPEIREAINESIRMYASKVYSVNDHVLIMLKEHTQVRERKPLLATTWGQGYYPENEQELHYYLQRDQYNMYVPNYYPVGCVALAVAQIMRYHESPRNFDWGAMLDHMPTQTTAQFLYGVARGVDTRFAPDGSGSNIKKAKKYLKRMGYSARKIDSSDIFYVSKLYAELANRCPVYVRGRRPQDKDGHAFVLDGYYGKSLRYEIKVMSLPDAPPSYLKNENLECIYSTDAFEGILSTFHLNLGWSGQGNGDYVFDNFREFNKNREYLLITPPTR